MTKVLKALASLRLTVALMWFSLVLIFVGTLAQAYMGVWEAVASYFRSPIAWVDPGMFLPGVTTPLWLRFPIPGGLTIGVLMMVNLIAAHTMRFKMIPKRFGIVMLHAGLIVLLAGEFVTGFFSREGLMRIDVDGQTNFVEDLRTAELAIIDPSDPESDRVISIPGSMIVSAAESGKPIAHDAFPFEITVDEWMANAQLFHSDGPTKADRGVGIDAFAQSAAKVSGADTGTDAPAAYVTLHQDGNRLGTWLLSADLMDAQPVLSGDKRYGMALRFKRTYKPYTLHLLEFRHDKFVGTEVARNFSSRVRLVDERTDTDREVVIWMNNPLRHAGETFYQASYMPDGTGTVLQVVKNPGAALPYIASAMVAVGMVGHFLLSLIGYLKRERKALAAKSVGHSITVSRGLLQHSYPAIIGILGLLLAMQGIFRQPKAEEYDLNAFATIPVSSGGRIKPMDTAARHLLSVTSGRQSLSTEDGNVSATQFLLDLIANPDQVRDAKVLRVDHPDVLALMNLRPEDAGRLSMETVEPHWDSIVEQAMRASSLSGPERDAYQRAVLALYQRVNQMLTHAAMEEPYSIPPQGPDAQWQPFQAAFAASQESETLPHPAVAYQVAILTAYSEGDAVRFNRVLGGYLELLNRDMAEVMFKSRVEVFFNRARPFVGAIVVYTLAFLLICFSMLLRMRQEGSRPDRDWSEILRVSAVALLWAAIIVHTLAIIIRIYLQGRPPVTNLYSSAIFVGWAAVLLGLVLEQINRLGVAALGASAVGFSTLVVAHNLGTDGDTMQMMQAVLDSNFWLATHVITITLGYSATFLAGALAIVYLVLGIFTKYLTAERARALTRMVYGIICFALLLSFVGTVLGGIWADQSWGRFWGWDPKENGASLVVLITAIILHARWGGMIRERGIMVLAVFGNIITAWSWFGTNMLGVGLHSYGFMDSAVMWMMIFVGSQLLIMGLAWIPQARWLSFRKEATS